MAKAQSTPRTIDEYIASFPPDVQKILQKIRLIVRKAAPDAEETISYRMPAFRKKKILVYFAAFKNHIGLYPPVKGAPALLEAVAPARGRRAISGSRSISRSLTS